MGKNLAGFDYDILPTMQCHLESFGSSSSEAELINSNAWHFSSKGWKVGPPRAPPYHVVIHLTKLLTMTFIVSFAQWLRFLEPSGELGTGYKACCKLESETPNIASAVIAGKGSLKDSLDASVCGSICESICVADFQLPLTEVRKHTAVTTSHISGWLIHRLTTLV